MIVLGLVTQTLSVSCISHSLAIKLNIPRWLFLENSFSNSTWGDDVCVHPQLWNPGIPGGLQIE